jgi:hypothetical protein
MPSENLLGNNLYITRVSDEAAAQRGLDELLGTLGTTISSFTDPFSDGTADSAIVSTDRMVEGVLVKTTTLTDGVTISYAVTDGFALFSTDDTSVSAALEAHASGDTLGGHLAELVAQVPQDATSYTVSDDRALVESTAAEAGVQLQTLAALSMGTIDFTDLEDAGDKLEEFLLFVAARLGGSMTYSTVQDGQIITSGFSEISW